MILLIILLLIPKIFYLENKYNKYYDPAYIERLKKQIPMHIMIYQGGIEQSFSVEKPLQIGAIEIKPQKEDITNKPISTLKSNLNMYSIIIGYTKPFVIGFIIGYYNSRFMPEFIYSIKIVKYFLQKSISFIFAKIKNI